MTGWRALTLKQPWPWAICWAGKNVENRTWPIPPKLLEDGPLRVMLHAGAALDDAIRSNDFGGTWWTPPTMETLELLEWCPDPVHADPCECDEDELILDGRCAELSAPFMKLAFAPDPGAHTLNPIGMGTTKPWCPECEGTGWAGGRDGRSCDCDDEPVDEYRAWVHRGAVVAVVEFTGCHMVDDDGSGDDDPAIGCLDDDGQEFRDGYGLAPCSPWAVNEIGTWHWEIGAVTVLDEPVPARGRQRLWVPDGGVLAAVEAQL